MANLLRAPERRPAAGARGEAARAPRLVDFAPQVFVAAYREETSTLVRTLEHEGFAVDDSRIVYDAAELAYPLQSRCLLTHRRIWRRCAELERPAVVAEADFVPVRGFGRLPLPFEPSRHGSSFAWLYAVSPTLYRREAGGHVIGDSSGTVCYVLDATGARALLDLFDETLSKRLADYSTWDSQLGPYLRRQRGIPTYVPFRQYGEHGGKPNPEHARLGAMPPHRADCLFGRLSFVPEYAANRRLRFLLVRLWAKWRGIARVLLGRTVRRAALMRRGGPALLLHAMRRLATPH